MHDLRDAFRALRSTPVVSIVAMLSLALGIGANSAIFSILDSLILRELPVKSPEQLVIVGDGQGRRAGWTNPIWEEMRARPSVFDGAFAWSSTRFNLARGGQTELVDGLWASGRIFDTLGVPAILGRTFTEADDRRGGGPDGPVAVISYGFWQRRFDGAADVIGRTLTVERVPFTIVGVTPPRFFGVDVGRTFDVAIPIGTEPLIRGKESALDKRSNWWLTVMSRLKPGQSEQAATAAIRGVAPQIREATMPPDWRAQDQALPEGWVQPDPGGERRLRPARALPPAAHDDHGGGRAGPADCLRQHRQPAAGARDGAPPRAEHPGRARRVAIPDRAPAADREPAPLDGRRRARTRLRAMGQPAARAAAVDVHQQRVPVALARLAHPRVHRGGGRVDGGAVRHGAGAARHARAAERRTQGTGARRGRRRQAWARERAGRAAGGALADARGCRGPVHADVRLAGDARPRLRSQRRARRRGQRAAGAARAGGAARTVPPRARGCGRGAGRRERRPVHRDAGERQHLEQRASSCRRARRSPSASA